MTKKIELIMPKMGESINEATILSWLKKEGDEISLDEPILEIATDKVDTEVPSPVNGTISKTLFNEGDVIEVGKAIAILETSDEVDADTPVLESDDSPSAASEEKSETSKTEAAPARAESTSGPVKEKSKGDRKNFYSPLVMNIAREENVSMNELENINGSGKEGRVTKQDILAFIETRTKAPETKEAPKTSAQTSSSIKSTAASVNGVQEKDVPVFPGDEIIEMDRMRKLISEHMSYSKKISPHVTSFVEADVTNIVNWRNKHKNEFQKREGGKLTFTPIFIEAIAKAIKDFPMVNISISGDKIIKRKNINIGMAAALPSGNLIVPVIKNADHKNLTGLAKEVNDLAGRARENKLLPDEIQGGTITMTNVGTFGNLSGTPVIFQPQVAILATGSIIKKPAVVETEFGDVIAIRHLMFLSLSYDHRVVDGALGGGFLRKIADYLEAFDVNREL